MSNTKTKIEQIFSFSLYECRIFTQSWLIYLKWDLLISFFSYKRWQSHLACLNSTNSYSKNQSIAPERLHNIIKLNEKAGRNHFRKMNCLRRCLCQKELLNNVGIDCALHLGVKFVEGKLAAHSWLSINNDIINDSQEVVSTYEELINVNNENALLLFK